MRKNFNTLLDTLFVCSLIEVFFLGGWNEKGLKNTIQVGMRISLHGTFVSRYSDPLIVCTSNRGYSWIKGSGRAAFLI